MISLILTALGFILLFDFGGFAMLSLRDGERRAAFVAVAVAVVTSLLFFLSALQPGPIKAVILGLVAAALVGSVILFLLPVGRVDPGKDEPRERFDERNVMFARARLIPGSPDYKAYYASHPENRASDEKTRSLPGLLSLEASEANPLIFAATDAAFGLTEALRDAVDGPVADAPTDHDAVGMSAYLKNLARYLGARDAGIAELEPYHVYSHIGRGSGAYGAPIALNHRHAIAFTVEMDHALVNSGPAAPTALESARQYVEAAKIALQLGNLIRSLGYAARAHIDGNYRVIAPLVARDAGLGEIGRMGLLMTPSLGPRVRLGVVTTDLPLIPDGRGDYASMIDYCRLCEKCATACPVRAIPRGDRIEIDGALRWRIDADVCFRYWSVVGTDCGRCMAVCPYSHPDNLAHNLVRWAVGRSGMARRAVVRLDTLFYGANPPPKSAPAWLPPKPERD